MQAVQHDPELLILDEPSEGLDPLVQEGFFALLRGRRDAGRTVFLSSHVLSEVERLCERVALIRAGRIVDDGTIERLRAGRARRVRVVLPPESPSPAGAARRARSWSATATRRAGSSRPPGPLLARAGRARPARRHHRGAGPGGDLPRLLPRGCGSEGLSGRPRAARCASSACGCRSWSLFAGLWGFLLVALFATSDAQTQSLSNQPGNLTVGLPAGGPRPAGGLGLARPGPSAVPARLRACSRSGSACAAIAGELEAGTLELTLARPLRRSTYLAAHVLLLAPGALLIARRLRDGDDDRRPRLRPARRARCSALRMLAAALLAACLVLALGGIALLASALPLRARAGAGLGDRRDRRHVRPQRPAARSGIRSRRSPGCRCSGTSRPAPRSSAATSSGGTRSCWRHRRRRRSAQRSGGSPDATSRPERRRPARTSRRIRRVGGRGRHGLRGVPPPPPPSSPPSASPPSSPPSISQATAPSIRSPMAAWNAAKSRRTHPDTTPLGSPAEAAVSRVPGLRTTSPGRRMGLAMPDDRKNRILGDATVVCPRCGFATPLPRRDVDGRRRGTARTAAPRS